MEYTRRFPLTEDFMSYKVDDLLYGYLQYKATYNPNKDRLYISLDNLRKSKSNIETMCGCSRRTIDRQIKSLIQDGMVEEVVEDNKYIYSLPYVGNRYQIIDWNMLEYLLNTRNHNSIRLYVYLLNKYLWKQDKEENYCFTIAELAEAIGYQSKQTSTNRMIEDILNSFYLEGVIKWREVIETITRSGKAIPRIRKELLFVAQHKEELAPVVIERVKRASETK